MTFNDKEYHYADGEYRHNPIDVTVGVVGAEMVLFVDVGKIISNDNYAKTLPFLTCTNYVLFVLTGQYEPFITPTKLFRKLLCLYDTNHVQDAGQETT